MSANEIITRYTYLVDNFAFNTFLALRPKQWVKNVLLFVAPFASGVYAVPDLLKLAFAFAIFSIASSIGYVINDLNDIEIDRYHPIKASRPFASEKLSKGYGYFLACFLCSILISSFFHFDIDFVAILLLYLLNSFIYTKCIKSVPVIELFVVALGFILRLVAGAVLFDLVISEWFLIVGGFGALYIVSAKRLAEFKNMDSRVVRRVVSEYNQDFLNTCITTSISVTTVGYCLWAYSHEANPLWFQLSVFPFVLALFRYRWLSEKSLGEAPEDAILGDKTLLSITFVLIGLLAIGIY